MRTTRAGLTFTALVLAAGAAPANAQGGAIERKMSVNVGVDAVERACVVRRVFGDDLVSRRGDRAFDLVCGPSGATPAGRLYIFASSERETSLQNWSGAVAANCAGGAPQAWSPLGLEARISTFCAGEGASGGAGKTAMMQMAAASKDRIFAGDALPAAAPALERAMRVLEGLEAEPVEGAKGGPRSALLESLQSALGDEISGGGFADFVSLRRLAFESNALWLFTAAERQFADAVRMHAALWPKDFAGRADLQAERALNLANQRRFAEADSVLAEARANAEQGRDAYVLAKVESYGALVALNAGEMEKAAAQSRRARDRIIEWRRSGGGEGRETTASTIPVSERIAILDAQMARTEALIVRKRDPEAARSALKVAAQQASRLDPRASSWLRAAISQDEAQLEMAQKRPAEAVRILRAALADYRKGASGSRVEANLLMDLGAAERANGRNADALVQFREAFAIYREQPENFGVGAERALAYLGALTEGQAPGEEIFNAFETVASPAVAQTAAGTAARLQAGAGGETIRALQDGDRALRRALARQAGLSPDAPPTEKETAEADVARLRAEVAQLERAVDAKFPNFGVVTLKPLELAELQEALGEGERVLRIAVGAAGGVGLVIDKDRVKAYPIPIGESEATAYVNRIKNSVRNPEFEFDAKAAEQLFAALFGPVREEILAPESPNRLVIEASGALASLPFGVLLTGPTTGETPPWLSRQRALVTAPSMRAFVLARKARSSEGSRAFVGFGDFTSVTKADPARRSELIHSIVAARRLPPGCVDKLQASLAKMPPLPGTARELAAVRQAVNATADALILGSQFTDTAVLQSEAARSARVLMFSTHGFFAADFPDAQGCLPEAALLTSATDGATSAFIDSGQVLDMKLDADLVVLSACDTGNPQPIAPGESGLPSGGDALSGLARAFLYAGARNVMVSHWVLPDEDTAALMTTFFTKLAAGMPAPEALQQAQLAQIQSGAGDPLQWGALVIVGAPPPVNSKGLAGVQTSFVQSTR